MKYEEHLLIFYYLIYTIFILLFDGLAHLLFLWFLSFYLCLFYLLINIFDIDKNYHALTRMAGRLKHRPVSSSRSVSSTSNAATGNNGRATTNQQTNPEKKATRSRTDSGERLTEEDRPTIKAVGM